MERLALPVRALRTSIPALLFAAFAASPAIAAVGQIIFVSGEVRVTDQAGRTRAAARGDSIDEGDSVATAAGASAQLRMVDQGFIAVRSDTEMKFDRYRYTGKEDGKENALMSLVKGGFRTITGIIGRTNKTNYLVRTPAATIGIRGTDHEPFFIPQPLPGQIPLGNPGAYNKVNSGVTAMTTQVGTVVIGANQVAYAASQNAAPTLLPSVPSFFRPTAAPVAKAPAEKPEAEKPGAEKPAAEKPAAEKPAAEKPAAEKPVAEKPAAPKPAPTEVAEKPAAEKPAAVKPAAPAPEVAVAPKPAALAPEAPPAPAPAPEPIRAVAVVDNPAQIAAAVAVATAPPPTVAPAPAPVVAPTPTVVAGQQEVTAEATGVTGIVTLNITEQEATAGQFVYDVETGTTTDTTTGKTFEQTTVVSGGLLAIGDFGILAQAAADDALAAKISLSTIESALGTTAAGTTAQQLYTDASTAYGDTSTEGTVQGDASYIAARQAINTSLAASNLASVTSVANTAASQVSTATSVNSANSNVANGVGGTDFRDSQAAGALALMNSAYTMVQGAKTLATSGNNEASTQSSNLTSVKNSAAAKLQSATTAFNNTQTTFNAITAAPQVQTGVTNANQWVSNLFSLASAAYSAAQSHADLAKSYQAAQDFTKAQEEFNFAQDEKAKAESYLALAQQIQSLGGVSSAQADLALLRISADAAKTDGDAAVDSTTSALSSVNTSAATVKQQSVIAQYSNPTIAATNRFGHVVVGSKPAPTSSEKISLTGQNKPNTDYVLDHNSVDNKKNLVEVRSNELKVTQGTQKDTFNFFASTSGSENYVALGRWEGGATPETALMVNVGGVIYDLGTRSLHWLVGYLPPANYVRSLTGTATYTQLAATRPTDAAGTVGTLTSASLTANFDTQKVDASVGVSVGSKSVSGSGLFPISPVDGLTFGGNFSTVTSGWSGDLQGAFSGEKATGAGFGYNFLQGSGPYTDLIQGVVAFSTSTAPTVAPTVNLANTAAADALKAYDNPTWESVSGDKPGGKQSLALVLTAIGDASTAKNAANAVVTPTTNQSTAQTAIDSATTAIGDTSTGATKSVTDAAALSLTTIQSDAGTKALDAAGKKTLVATAVGGASSGATKVYTDNASFRDPVYATQTNFDLMNQRKTEVDTAEGKVASAKSTIDTQAGVLTTKQGDAQTALNSAKAALGQTGTTGAIQDKSAGDAQLALIGPAVTASGQAYTTASDQQTPTEQKAGLATDPGATDTSANARAANAAAASSCATTKACSELAQFYAAETFGAQQGGDIEGALNAKNNTLTARDRALQLRDDANSLRLTAQGAASTAATKKTEAVTAASNAVSSYGSAETKAGTGATGAQGLASTAGTRAGEAVSAYNTANTAYNGAANADALVANYDTVTTKAADAALLAKQVQYSNPTIATLNRFSHVVVGSKPATGGSDKISSTGQAKPNTDYVLDHNSVDSKKNLVEVRTNDVKVTQGTQKETFNFFDSTSGSENYVALGRWEGSPTTPLKVTVGGGAEQDLGSRSLHWLVGYQPPSNYVQSRTNPTGTASVSYSQVTGAATSPTDAAGAVGTLTSASLSVDFASQMVNAGVGVSVGGKSVSGSGSFAINPSAPTFGGNFSTVTGSTSGWSGDLQGAFSGAKASGAGFGYNFYQGSGPYTDLIQGVVAFSTATEAPARPVPAANIATSYVFSVDAATATTATAFDAASYTTDGLDGAGNLLTVAANPLSGSTLSEAVSGGTAQTIGSATAGTMTVKYGRWQGAGVSVDASGSPRSVLGSYNWVKGPAVTLPHLGQAVTATVNFNTSIAGEVTDNSNNVGTINTGVGKTSLTVDFARQAVTTKIDATVGSVNWVGTASNVALQDGLRFSASTLPTAPPHSQLTVTRGCCSADTTGVLSGSLMGAGLNGAGVAFAFSHPTSSASGAVAFATSTTQSASAEYASGVIAAGNIDGPVDVGFDLVTLQPTYTPVLTNTKLAALDANYANSVQTATSAAARTTRFGSTQNFPGSFDMQIPVANPAGCTSTPTCTGVATIPATIAMQPNDYPASGPPGTPTDPLPSSMLANFGADTATGIRWGRYVGFVQYTDRIDGVTGSQFDARTRNWHAIWADTQNSAPVLPTTGTATYTLVGNTNPTDNLGNVGTLTTGSTSLFVNFGTQKVDTNVALTVNSQNWSASAANVPIVNAGFMAQRINGAGNLTVTAPIGGQTAGVIKGVFTGNATSTTGGAMMGYSLNAGGASGTTVSGVIGFKK